MEQWLRGSRAGENFEIYLGKKGGHLAMELFVGIREKAEERTPPVFVCGEWY